MEWGLFVLAIALVAVLQYVVWRRLQHGDVDVSDPIAPGDAAPPSDPRTESATTPEPADDPDVTTCPSCGTRNETGYRFCRECVTMLYA